MATATTTRKASKGGRRRNSRRLRDLRAQALDKSSIPDIANPFDAAADILRREVGWLEFFRAEADKLTEKELWRDTMVGRIPHEAIREERNASDRVAALSFRMIQIGLDEKRLQLDEAKINMLGAALLSACEDAGLDESTRKRLGAALRTRLTQQMLEAGK